MACCFNRITLQWIGFEEFIQFLNKVSMVESWSALTVSKTSLHLHTLLISNKGLYSSGLSTETPQQHRSHHKRRTITELLNLMKERKLEATKRNISLWSLCEHEQRPSFLFTKSVLHIPVFQGPKQRIFFFFHHKETTREIPLFDLWHLFGLPSFLPSQIG